MERTLLGNSCLTSKPKWKSLFKTMSQTFAIKDVVLLAESC